MLNLYANNYIFVGKDSGVRSRRGRSRKMHCGRISFNPACPACVDVCGLLSWNDLQGRRMPPTRQSGSFPFQEVPFEIFPVLRSLKGSHQILVNLLINMESTADFFFISPPNCSRRRETKPHNKMEIL